MASRVPTDSSATVAESNDTSSITSSKGKEKFIHSFISAMEHLLPIDHKNHNDNNMHLKKKIEDPVNEKPLNQKNVDGNNDITDDKKNINERNNSSHDSPDVNESLGSIDHLSSNNDDSGDINRSQSFLNNLNSILQNNGHMRTPTSTRFRQRSNTIGSGKRASIFSDSEIELNKQPNTSPFRESSLNSVGFCHVVKSNDLSFDNDEIDSDFEMQSSDSSDISDSTESKNHPTSTNNKKLIIKNNNDDDYVIGVENLSSSKSNTNVFDSSFSQKKMSDKPLRSQSLNVSGSNSQGRHSISKVKPQILNESLSADKKEEESTVKNKKPRFKRSGTITIAPLGLNMLRSRSRSNSINRKGIIDNRSKSNSSATVNQLVAEKSNGSIRSSNDDTQSSSDDDVEEVFSCALQKDILVQGKLYLTKSKINFKSRIFGIKTEVSFFIKDIVQLEKKFTAILFPNGIIIKTVDRDYIFASFLNRDLVFEKIMKRWGDIIMSGINENNTSNSDPDKISSSKSTDEKPSQQNSHSQSKNIKKKGSSEIKRSKSGGNIVFKIPQVFESCADGMSLAKPIKQRIHGVEESAEESDDDSEESDDSNNEHDDNDDNNDDDMTSSDEYEPDDSKETSIESGGVEKDDVTSTKSLGPSIGKPYKPDLEPYSKNVTISDDVIINTTLGKVFKIFSDNMETILEKGGNYNISKVKKLYPYDDDNGKLKPGKFKREYVFTKPLNSSLGPKETTCNVSESLIEVDLNKYFIIEQKTLTPDVPSGKSFNVVTHIIFFWSDETDVTIKSYTKVNWTGKSWIKGPVENGNTSGQKQAMQSLVKGVQEMSDNFKKSKQTGKDQNSQPSIKKEKQRQPTEKKKKVVSKQADLESAKTATEPTSFISGLISSLTTPQNPTVYLTWFIMFYLLWERIFGGEKTVVIQQGYTPEAYRASETEIWSWILKRTEDNFDDKKRSCSSEWDFDSKTLDSFKKQELYGLKEVMEKQLKAVDDAFSKDIP
ncbi:hypothetical protein QEN19_001158 [Hanseniaspora menglaensis]